MPSATVLGGGALGRWLDHEDGALMNGISALIKETPDSTLAPSAMSGYSEKMAMYIHKEGFYQVLSLQAPGSWTSWPPELWETNFCCF